MEIVEIATTLATVSVVTESVEAATAAAGGAASEAAVAKVPAAVEAAAAVAAAPYYAAFRRIHLYTKQQIVWSDQVVSYLSECTNSFGDKCMHQYTELIYFKLSSKFEILRLELRSMPSMIILKDAVHNKTRLKKISFKTNRAMKW